MSVCGGCVCVCMHACVRGQGRGPRTLIIEFNCIFHSLFESTVHILILYTTIGWQSTNTCKHRTRPSLYTE